MTKVAAHARWMLARVRSSAVGASGVVWSGAFAALLCAAVGCGGSSSGTSLLDAGADHSAPDVVAMAVRACPNDNACGGLQPRCDLSTSRCVPCATAGADCVAGSICDGTTGSCVDCLADADCGSPTARCDPKSHLCIATCRTARDCGTAGAVCDTAHASCAECTTDAQCKGGQRCDPGTSTCVDCLVDAHCPRDAPVCTSGHTCSDACVTDADCGAGSPGGGGFCDPRSHLCADCLENGDCGADSYCRADGTCA